MRARLLAAGLAALLGAALMAPTPGCRRRALGLVYDAGPADAALPDASLGPCVPQAGGLDCVTIAFPPQPTEFTPDEAAAGIAFAWEVIAPRAVGEVYPRSPDAACCGGGAGPLLARETVSGEGQYYCDCDHGLCDPSGCQEPPAMRLASGRYPQTFSWPGVNWTGPSDTGLPYGPPFPPGTYVFTVSASGSWRPAPGAERQPYVVTGELRFSIRGDCGGVEALQEAMWRCTGGAVGEGGLCLSLEVDAEGRVTNWTADQTLDPTTQTCIDRAIQADCFPAVAGRTEIVCIFGV